MSKFLNIFGKNKPKEKSKGQAVEKKTINSIGNTSPSTLAKCSSITFTHKWSIENFLNFYQKDNLWKSYICSEDFAPPNNEQFELVLFLYPDDDDNCVHISIGALALPPLYDGKIRCKFRASIVNENDEICYSEEHKEHALFQWQCSGVIFVHHLKIVLSIRKFLPNNRLTLFFKIHLQADEEIFNSPNAPACTPKPVTTKSHTDAATKVTRLSYTWTIENICGLLKERDTNIPWFIQSDYFPSDQNQNHRFYLRLYPDGFDANNKGCIDIGVMKDNDATMNCKISIFAVNGEKNYTREETRKTTYYRRFIEKFINRDFLLNPANGLLSNGKLSIHCEISYMTNAIEEKRVNMRVNEYDNIFKMESIYDVAQKMFHYSDYTWTIEKFESLYSSSSSAEQKRCPPLNTRVFTLFSDPRMKFSLQLWPSGDERQRDDANYVYIELMRSMLAAEKGYVDAPAQFRISILKQNGQTYTHEKWQQILPKERAFCRVKLTDSNFLHDPTNALLTDGNLNILCEIWVINDKKFYYSTNNDSSSITEPEFLRSTGSVHLGNINNAIVNINAKLDADHINLRQK